MASKGLLCSKLCDSFINLFKAVENFFLCMDCTFGVTFHSFYCCYFAWKMSMLFLRGNNSQFNQKYINQDKFRLQALNWSFPQVDPVSKKREHINDSEWPTLEFTDCFCSALSNKHNHTSE